MLIHKAIIGNFWAAGFKGIKNKNTNLPTAKTLKKHTPTRHAFFFLLFFLLE